MRKEATALSRAKVLRPILEIEEQGFPVSCALEGECRPSVYD